MNKNIGLVAVLVILFILSPILINCVRIFSVLWSVLYTVSDDDALDYTDVEADAVVTVRLVKPELGLEDLPRYLPRYCRSN